MYNRKSVLEIVRNIDKTTETQSEESIRIKRVINKLYIYYKIYDLEHGTLHSKIFNMLYLSDVKYTYKQIEEKLYIGHTTLKRYVKQYERLALLLLEANIDI